MITKTRAVARIGGLSVTLPRNSFFARDVVVMGGCGRAGLPPGAALAGRRADVTVCDRACGAGAGV